MMVRVNLFILFGLLLLICSRNCTVYFDEDFSDVSDWVKSSKNSENVGEMTKSSVKYLEDVSGFKTKGDSKFFHYGSKLSQVFETAEKDLYFHFTLVHEQQLSCGGGYLKLLTTDDLAEFHGDSDYAIMFGPDSCGSTKMIHLIFNYKGKNYLKKNEIRYSSDSKAHVYSLVFKADKTYQVQMDGVEAAAGKVEEDWELFGKKTIDDKEDFKPTDWVNESEIDDPKDTKPEDWDKPETLKNEDATEPEDWNSEEDGEWVAPMKMNPDFKGEWSPKRIPNPDYKGEFVPKQIDNPDYVFDKTFSEYSIQAVGVDVWQVESGSVYGNILLTDDSEKSASHLKKCLEFVKSYSDAKEIADRLEKDQLKKDGDEEKALEEEDARKSSDEAAAQADSENEIDANLEDEL